MARTPHGPNQPLFRVLPPFFARDLLRLRGKPIRLRPLARASTPSQAFLSVTLLASPNSSPPRHRPRNSRHNPSASFHFPCSQGYRPDRVAQKPCRMGRSSRSLRQSLMLQRHMESCFGPCPVTCARPSLGCRRFQSWPHWSSPSFGAGVKR